MSSEPTLAICVPVHRGHTPHLSECLHSVEEAAPVHAELIISTNSPNAVRALESIDVSGWKLLEPRGRTDLVENWNRCLLESECAFVHLLHEDDYVANDFYVTVLDLIRAFPSASLIAVGSTGDESCLGVPTRQTPQLLTGDDAARFLLSDQLYDCGSVVISRRAVTRLGGFSDRFPYCPDEEAFLRWATEGGIAVGTQRLYFQRLHGGQERNATWARDDFVETYVRSRLDGASLYGREITTFARKTTRRRVASVATTLALSGSANKAQEVLDDLRRVDPGAARSCRYWTLAGLLRTSAGRRLLERRRVTLARHAVNNVS